MSNFYKVGTVNGNAGASGSATYTYNDPVSSMINLIIA